MKITKSTPIYIYGYGVRGRIVNKKLADFHLHPVAYIDKNAERYMDEKTDIPIVTLNCCEKLQVQDSVVFIAVANVFEHEKIAKELRRKGFQYFICKIFNETEQSHNNNELYEMIMNTLWTSSIEGYEIYSYEDVMRSVSAYKRCKKEFVSVSVPVNMLFGLTAEMYRDSLVIENEELTRHICDKSLLYFTLAKGMAHYFNSEYECDEWNDCLEIWFESRNAQTYSKNARNEDVIEKNINIDSRYSVFQKMDILFSKNRNFFYDNPVSVVWNENGYFNMEDGNNRAAFLLEKGMNEIPCVMRCDDYEKWQSSETIVQGIKTLLQKEKLSLFAPITHPELGDLESHYYTWSYIKLKCLCEFLKRKKFEISGKKVIEIGSKNDLCGQHLARMGAELTIIEEPKWLLLNQYINELLYIKNVVYKSDCCWNEEEADIVLVRELSSSNLKKIFGIRYTMLLSEFIDISEEEVQEIALEMKCHEYYLIRKQVVGSKVHSFYCFV